MLFAAAGLPGVLAAAQGVRFEAPICGPSGTDLPTGPGPAANSHNDHCKLFPCGGLAFIAAPADDGLAQTPLFGSGDGLAAPQATFIAVRAELTPLNGRAPPSHS